MRIFSAIRSHGFSYFSRRVLSSDWAGIPFPEKRFYCRANFAESGTDDLFSSRNVSLLAAEKENIPNTLATLKEKSVALPVPPPHPRRDSNKLKAMLRVSEKGPTGELPPHVVYLIELGMDLEQLKGMASKFPPFANYSLEGKIKPVVEFLLSVGLSRSDISTILYKRPQLCGKKLSETLIPMMKYLENLGVEKEQWAKVIYRFPALLTYSRQKVKSNVDFLYELGITPDTIGKIITRCPSIVSYSVEDKLRPTAEYFCSLGVNVAILIYRYPQNFCLSIEGNLKRVTEFFQERGYSLEEIRTMISRYGALYTFSMEANLIPKWEFFLTMDYPRSELVKFPQYFGYSLEGRIKPRYELVKERGVKFLLNQMLTVSSSHFHIALERKMKKMLSEKDPSIIQYENNVLQSKVEQ